MENQQNNTVSELQSLRERISHTSQSDIKLYFIVRMLRDKRLKKQSVMSKYIYKAFQIDIEDGYCFFECV